MSFSSVLYFLALGLVVPIFCSELGSSATSNATSAVPSTLPTTAGPVQSTTTGPQLHNATFVLVNQTGFECARVSGTFQLAIKYKNTSGIELTNTLYIEQSQPGEIKAEGICDPNVQSLFVKFFDGWRFGFFFMRDSASSDANYYTKNLSLDYSVDTNHNFLAPANTGNKSAVYSSSELFTASNTKSYLCKALKSLDFDSNVTLTVTNLQLQAFKQTNSSSFVGDVSECLADYGSDSNLVPIIVGVCLAALVIVILVAYFIGRWRTSRNTAYQPV